MRYSSRLPLLVALMALPAIARCAPAAHLGPYLQNVDRESISILWETSDPVAGEVEAVAVGQAPVRAADKDATTFHELRLTGLTPGTRYSYRVRWPGYQSDAYSFRTAPPAGTSKFRLVAYGDTRTNPSAHSAIVAGIVGEKPDVVVHSGDLVANGKELSQWKPQFFDPLAALMREVCVFTVLGNHENNSPHYYRYFALPGNEAWYTFDYANARFFCLDTQQTCAPGSEQYRWLESQVQRQWAGWKIVVLHAPIFSVHPSRPVSSLRWTLQPLFLKYGVDITLGGHDHHYGRSHPVGPAFGPGRPTYHFITGGGGAPLYPVEKKPWAPVVNSTYNYVVLDFDGDRAAVRAMDKDGKEIDALALDRGRPVPAADLYAWEACLWERNLAEAVKAAAPTFVEGDTAVIDATLRLPAAPGGSVRGEVAWEGDGRWEFTPAVTPFQAKAGEALVLPVRARCPVGRVYPLPAATLRVTGGEPAWKFRNTAAALPAPRVAVRRSVQVAPAAAPQVDGRLDDACWTAAPLQEGFVAPDGGSLAAASTRFRLSSDGARLYVAAQMALAAKPAATEALFLRIGVEKALFDVQVAADGQVTCTRNGEAGWDAGVKAAVSAGAEEWSAEVAVPLAAMGAAGGRPLRLNVVRSDGRRRERSEWAPTFGQGQRTEWYARVLLPAP